MGLPYKRDGFWMGTVRRLYPQNKTSNWEGAWIEDGLPSEVFSSVVSDFCYIMLIFVFQDILNNVLLSDNHVVIRGAYLELLKIQLNKVSQQRYQLSCTTDCLFR